jgi:hypothetical protein
MSKARDLANAGTALGAVDATELGYLDGVTSAVQTQIDSKIGAASAINPTIVDAKGDIIAATAADTVARLAVGANDTVLTADSTAATGLKWGGDWTAFTPSVSNLTVGNGTFIGRYRKIGKTCEVYFRLTFGSTTSVQTNPHFFLPFNYKNSFVAYGDFLDSGTLRYTGVIDTAFGAAAYFAVIKTDSTYGSLLAMTSTIPFTWTTNDVITFNFSYEVE